MRHYVFDLLYTDPDQVREFLTAMAKEGLVGGVYLWINKVNGKMYVGSSVNLYSRMKSYFSLKHTHGIIGQALRKYGFNDFVLVLFLFPNATASLVLAMEQSVLDVCACAYNIALIAGSTAGVKLSEETKTKMSAAKKGHKHSDETKEKISSSQAGENNGRFNTGKPVYLYVVHSHGFELSATFSNAVRCSETLGIPYTTLVNRVKNRPAIQTGLVRTLGHTLPN